MRPMKVTDEMVNRFLAWPLPRDFGPDCGISFTPIDHPHSWPVGTNLFTAEQAKKMLEHVLAGNVLARQSKGDEMPVGDEFHKYEVVDRAHTVFMLLSELLGEHQMLLADEELSQKYDRASNAIYDLYSAADAAFGRNS